MDAAWPLYIAYRDCSRDLHLRAGSLKIHLFHSFSKQIFNKNDK
jgi:hypothetical protein